MAHKKAGGSTRNGRDSQSKRLGIKKYGGQRVRSGNIILRQRGTHYLPATDGSVGVGKDYTIFAQKEGVVTFTQVRKTKYNGQKHRRTQVAVA